MNYSQNPFQELYVADTVSQEHFVRLFSRYSMESLNEFHQLFQLGNLVLLGSQGCGKTMLLTLLRPEIRVAYAKYNEEEFPVPEQYRRFLSAGINLTKSGISHLAGVSLGDGYERDIHELPYFFGDFFNHKIVLDLLENVEKVAESPEIFERIVSLEGASEFVVQLRKQDCWSGALDGCASIQDVKERIQERLACYRKWMGHNVRYKGAPELLRESKSTIGEPIVRTVECMKNTGVIEDVPVFIRIDQIEELAHSPAGPPANLRLAFRQVLNGALSRRDLRVAYRLGSRPYGWDTPGCLNVMGGGVLEEKRDFHAVNFDAVWGRTENVRSKFEKFASDAFGRRIKYYLQEEIPPHIDLLDSVFSRSADKYDRIEPIFVSEKQSPASYERELGMSDREEMEKWTLVWRDFLAKLYQSDPLEAVLAAAWGRQTGGGRGKPEHRNSPPPSLKPYPWQKLWWRKERLTMAVLQYSARRGQRLMWWGKRDILDLSGGNILAFLGVCHAIWNQFLKMEQGRGESDKHSNPLLNEPIDRKLQAIGIQDASKVWYNKLAEHTPEGDIRQRFIGTLGIFLRRSLREDKKMSYPGGNGFSIAVGVLDENVSPNREACRFLKQCVSWGALVAFDHTTKMRSGERRLKFYLHPILSPVFQLPVARTKEPLYWELDDLLEILERAAVPFLFALPKKENVRKLRAQVGEPNEGGKQLKLF